MAETDLGKIVGMIMENPELVEKIRAMGRGSEEATDEEGEAEPSPPSAPNAEASGDGGRGRRNTLLSALKPFVSEGRRKALESMISIADVLETMRGK